MSLLQYGPFYLNLVEMRKYDRRAVYSGPNYMFHRHRLQARYVLNPGTQKNLFGGYPTIGNGKLTDNLVPTVPAVRDIAISRAQPGAGFPGPGGNVPAVSSDAAIRHMLMQPRQQLVYSLLGVPVLISPLPGFTTDVSGGPFPQGCDVEQIGARTYHVIFDVQTDVNETTQYLGSPKLPVVLAHTWNMEHVQDDAWFVARVIEGTVTFRRDLLNVLKLNPDDFRHLIFHPVPLGFKRERVEVRAQDDAYTLKYRIVDRESPISWPVPNVAKIEAIHTYRITKANTWDGLWKGISQMSLIRPQGGLLDALHNAVATAVHRVEAKVYGGWSATRFGLEKVALSIVRGRIAGISIGAGDKLLGGIDIQLTHNIHKHYVEAALVFIAGPVGGLMGPIVLDNPNGSVTGPEDTAYKGTVYISTTNATPIPQAPNDAQTRGNYLEIAVASALAQPLQSPALPPSVPPTFNANTPLLG